MNIQLEIDTEGYTQKAFTNMKAGQVYVDVGAYDGDTIISTLSNCPGLRIIGIEPIKTLCDEMNQKFKGNSKITIVNKACWSGKGIITFNEYMGWGKGLSTIKPFMTQLRPVPVFGTDILKYEVEADTLDNILESCGIDKVDYLKVDTEGSEEEVLLSFTKYHLGTQFHIEFHMVNLANILQTLVEMGASIDKVTISRDPNVNSHVIGAITGEFTRAGKSLRITRSL